jgi:hypothetical protein
MKRLATIAVVPFFAGFLFAQTQDTQAQSTQSQEAQRSQSETTTTNTTFNGTLVDAGCYSTHSHSKDRNSNGNSTTTTETTKDSTNCPVTTSSSAFGLMTQDGKYVALDPGGNQRVLELVKSNKDWQQNMSEHKPVTVQVIGTPNGDMIVVKEIK